MVDKDLETQDGAQQKADAAESAAESYADSEIESHRQNETHDTAQPPQSHALAGGIHDAATRAELNALVSDATLESESGAQSKANAAEASAESYADSEIENHRTGETHTTAQPPQNHDNSAHSENYTTEAEAEAAAPVESVNGDTGVVKTFYRQSNAPTGAIDGATWVSDSDGSGSDTSSRYNYNNSAGRWELDSAAGPSEPTLGTPVPGSIWRDTSEGVAKQYDGSGFVSLSPSPASPRWVKPEAPDLLDSVNTFPQDASNLVDGDTGTTVGYSSNGSYATYHFGFAVSSIRIYPTKTPNEAKLSSNLGTSRNTGDGITISPTADSWNEYSLAEFGDGFELGVPNGFNQSTDLEVAEIEVRRGVPPLS